MVELINKVPTNDKSDIRINDSNENDKHGISLELRQKHSMFTTRNE